MLAATRPLPDSLPAPASIRRRRLGLWFAVAVAIGCGLVWAYVDLPDSSARLASVPMAGANFSGENIALTELERTFFAGVNVVHRKYTLEGQEFFATVVDGTANRHSVHDPRFCFQGAGWQVAGERLIPTSQGAITALTLTRGSETASAAYWFTDGTSRHGSMLRYWSQTTLRRLSLGRSGPEPVLVVMQSLDAAPDWEKAATWAGTVGL